MESGFSSPRTDAFPAGLRVLVVDDDLVWLRILEKMLKRCSYEVTTCCLARQALDLLRERKDGFDIVISDVNMPDMDGFKLLEHVGLEMDLPVIMMSVDGETSRVMRGVQHGACDYLLKPIRMKELRNIWQHVFRKRIHEVRDIEGHDEVLEEIQMMRHGSDQSDDGHFLSGGDLNSGKKRKDAEHKYDNKDFGDPSSVKKARVVWTVDLHQKFVKAVNQIGFDKVGPKKILDLMNISWLTRENVASHLQKYRLYLSRLQKENELRASFCGTKLSDPSSKDPPGNLGIQNPIVIQKKDAANGIHRVSSSQTLVQNVNPKILDGEPKGVISLPTREPKKDIPDHSKVNNSRMGLNNNSFGQLVSDLKYARFDSAIPTQYSWSELQYKQEPKPHLQLENGFNHIPLPGLQHQVQVGCVQTAPSVGPRPFNRERDKPADIESNPFSAKLRAQQTKHAVPLPSAGDLHPVQSECHMKSFHTSEPILSTKSNIKNHGLDQIFTNGSESAQKNLILENCSGLASSDEDLLACFLQGDCHTMNIGVKSKESANHNYPELFAETQANLFDAHKFDYECPWETIEYPVIDQGLFIA